MKERLIQKIDYTTRARNFALRYPRANFILVQINFWLIAYLLLALIIHFNAAAVTLAHGEEPFTSLTPVAIMAIFAGIFYGLTLGIADEYLERKRKKGVCLGKTILLHAGLYFIVLIALKLFTRFVIWDYIIVPLYFNGVTPFSDQRIWKYYYLILAIYTFAMAFVISFINQMNKKFGPGILLPMLLGKYRNPQEEERIFMFMDLQSSTMHAENLGHVKYSSMIRDCFIDINHVLAKHSAEVYQYVGDEIVLSWPMKNQLDNLTCIEFYFECQKRFEQRSKYYTETYGVIPKFKAGLHEGLVTAVEVGEVKRDIAYHGDTLNTASRIQAKCNEYKSDLLVSDTLEKLILWSDKFKKEFVGEVILKGKANPVNLYSIQPSVV